MEPDDDKEVVIHGTCITGDMSIDTSSVYYTDNASWYTNDTSMRAEKIATEKDIEALDERLAKIEKRLAILAEPDQKLLDTYPSLREAYDAYKVIEKLVEGKHD